MPARPDALGARRTLRWLPMLLALTLSALLGALLAPPALAQSGIDVVVLDEISGQPLPNVELLLENAEIGLSRSAETDAQGRARFRALGTAGAYVVTATPGPAHEPGRSEPLVLRANNVATLTLTLLPAGALAEEVEVRAGAFARINTIDAEVSSTLRPQEVEALPIEGRDITRALFRLPNVVQATGFYPEAPNVSINGANSLYANYMIDGLDNNENFLGGQKFPIPTGFVQDVTILTSTYSAEFGRTGNGIFNVTSRSGSNELSGEVFYVTRPGDALDASSSFAGRDLSGNAVRDGFERHQFGVGVGGAIVPDKTFFYVNAERTRDDKDNLLSSPDLGVNQTIAGRNEFTYLSAKLDHLWRPDLRSSLRVNWGEAEIERQGGGLDGGVTFPSAASTQDRQSRHVAFRTNWTGRRMFTESALLYSRFEWDYLQSNAGAGPQVSVLGPDELPDAVIGHPGGVFDLVEDTLQLQQKFTFLAGDHTIKAGLEVVSSDFSLFGGGNTSGNYLVKLSEDQLAALRAQGIDAELSPGDLPADAEVLRYDVEVRQTSFGERQNVYSLYVEDLWSLSSRVNLTLGLRYDYDSLSEGGGSDADTDNLAPRVALNWLIDDKSVLRAGFGTFYDKILYAIYSDALQQNADSAGYRTQLQALIDRGYLPADTNIDAITFPGNIVAGFGPGEVGYLEGPTGAELAGQRDLVFSNERRILNPNGYDNPVTEQYTLGYQRQITPRMMASIDLIHTRSYNLFRLRNLNAPAPWNVGPDTPPDEAVRTPAEADATRPLADLGAIPGGARNIIMTETAGQARYRAATITLVQDAGLTPLSWRIAYTLSKLENNTDDINFRAQDANDYADEWGPSLNDRRHVLNAMAVYQFTPQLSVSLAGLLQSGQPVNRIPDAQVYGTTDLNGDGRSFGDAYLGNSDRQPGESRNSDRLPSSSVWDLGVRYLWPLGDSSIEVRMDVFNLFNEENLSGYANNATQSNQIQVGPASRGIVKRNEGPRRQFQFGVRYLF